VFAVFKTLQEEDVFSRTDEEIQELMGVLGQPAALAPPVPQELGDQSGDRIDADEPREVSSVARRSSSVHLLENSIRPFEEESYDEDSQASRPDDRIVEVSIPDLPRNNPLPRAGRGEGYTDDEEERKSTCQFILAHYLIFL